MEPSKPPRVFISYSWESEDHKRWVRYLGEKLYEAGIEARLDQWFVQPGESFTAFMEQEVTAADFVLVVCTPSYAHKSNKRQGGVGYEQQIVSGQLMAGTARSKFIPILREGDYEPGPDCAIPTHFLGIAWIEFRKDVAFRESLEDLIRVIFSKPRFAPPPLGTPPAFQTSVATALKPFEDALTYINRACAYIQKREYDLAIADCDRAVRLKQDYAEAYYARGVAYSLKKKYDPAIADYDQAIRLKQDYAEVYCERGTAYCWKKKYDLAIADYDRAIRLKQDYAEAYYARGNAYSWKKKYDPAIADFNQAIRLKQDYAEAYCARGNAYSLKKKYDPAIADFNQAIRLKQDYAEAYYQRGNVYSWKNEEDLAITDYDRAISLKQDYAEAYYARGVAYVNSGNKQRAIADFRKSLELSTDPGGCEHALRELRRLKAM